MSKNKMPQAAKARSVSFAVFLSGMAALSGCKGDPTQFLILVDSDLAPGRLTSVHAAILPDVNAFPADATEQTTFQLANVRLPLTFGVAPKDGDLDSPMVLLVEGLGPSGGAAVVSARLSAKFQEGKTLLLPIVLQNACIGVPCPNAVTNTCEEGICVSASLPPSRLQEVSPDYSLSEWRPPRPTVEPDAGFPPDLGDLPDMGFPDLGPKDIGFLDAGRDGGPRDMGPPPPDGGPPSEAGPPPDSGPEIPVTACSGPGDPTCNSSSTCRPTGDNGGCACELMGPRMNTCAPSCTANSECPTTSCGAFIGSGGCACNLGSPVPHFCVPGCPGGDVGECPAGNFMCQAGVCLPM